MLEAGFEARRKFGFAEIIEGYEADSNLPKNEREWFALRRIQEQEVEIADLRALVRAIPFPPPPTSNTQE